MNLEVSLLESKRNLEIALNESSILTCLKGLVNRKIESISIFNITAISFDGGLDQVSKQRMQAFGFKWVDNLWVLDGYLSKGYKTLERKVKSKYGSQTLNSLKVIEGGELIANIGNKSIKCGLVEDYA
jgi:hypothetical protein